VTSTCQVNKKIQEGRAVIVFFRDVKHVEEFKESSYFSKITNKILSCFIVENALGRRCTQKSVVVHCPLFKRFQSLSLRNVLLPNLTNQDKDWIARKAATCGQVTVAACSVSEGIFIDSADIFPMGNKFWQLERLLEFSDVAPTSAVNCSASFMQNL